MDTAKMVAIAVLVTGGAFLGGMVSNFIMGDRECENCERAMKLVMQHTAGQAQPGQVYTQPETMKPARLKPMQADRAPRANAKRANAKNRQAGQRKVVPAMRVEHQGRIRAAVAEPARPMRRTMPAMKLQPAERMRPAKQADPKQMRATKLQRAKRGEGTHAIHVSKVADHDGQGHTIMLRMGKLDRDDPRHEMMRRMMEARGESMKHRGRSGDLDGHTMKKRAMKMRAMKMRGDRDGCDAGECKMKKRGGEHHRGATRKHWERKCDARGDKRDCGRGDKSSCVKKRGCDGGRGDRSCPMMKGRDGKRGCDNRSDKPGRAMMMKRGGRRGGEMKHHHPGRDAWKKDCSCDRSSKCSRKKCDKSGCERSDACDKDKRSGKNSKRGRKHGGRKSAKVVEATEFRLVDKQGNVLAVLGSDEKGTGLIVMDSDGNARAILGVGDDGAGVVTLDENETPRALFGSGDKGAGAVFFDDGGLMMFGVGEDGPDARVLNSDGKPVWPGQHRWKRGRK